MFLVCRPMTLPPQMIQIILPLSTQQGLRFNPQDLHEIFINKRQQDDKQIDAQNSDKTSVRIIENKKFNRC